MPSLRANSERLLIAFAFIGDGLAFLFRPFLIDAIGTDGGNSPISVCNKVQQRLSLAIGNLPHVTGIGSLQQRLPRIQITPVFEFSIEVYPVENNRFIREILKTDFGLNAATIS